CTGSSRWRAPSRTWPVTTTPARTTWRRRSRCAAGWKPGTPRRRTAPPCGWRRRRRPPDVPTVASGAAPIPAPRLFSGVAFALGAGLIWGIVFVTPLILPDYPGLVLAFGRYLAFGLIAVPLGWQARHRLRALKR